MKKASTQCTDKNSNKGFTLVELLVVISVLIILTGVTISVLNPKMQRARAEDGIRMSNLGKLATGIESYFDTNAKYPTQAEMAPDVNNKPTGAEAAVFISKIPNGEPTATATYTYAVAADQASFGVFVPKATDTTSCYKYLSIWGKIKVCPLAKCPGVTDDAACI